MYQSQIKNTFKFEVISESQYGQYKIRCLQNSFTVCEKSVKSLMGPKNILRKELKSYATKKKLSAEEVTSLFTNNHKFC